MLDLGRYLLGVLEILLLGGFAWLGGVNLRRWLLPRFEGAPAHLATSVIALALLIWAAELLGSFGWLEPMPYLVLITAIGLGCWKFTPKWLEGDGSPSPDTSRQWLDVECLGRGTPAPYQHASRFASHPQAQRAELAAL